MNEKFGEFDFCVKKLDDAQEAVQNVWNDPVSRSYDVMNDNIKNALSKIWESFHNCSEGVAAIKTYYNAEEIDKSILLLSQKVEDK